MSIFRQSIRRVVPRLRQTRGNKSLSEGNGFTLVELLVSLAVASLLMPVIVSSIFQIVRGTDSNNNANIALADIDAVTSWLSRDLSQARSTDLVDCDTGTQTSVRVDWLDETDWGAASPAHYAIYYIDTGTTNLIRNYDGALSTIGRHVTAMTLCEVVASGIIELNVTTTATGASTSTKTLYFFVTPRPEA